MPSTSSWFIAQVFFLFLCLTFQPFDLANCTWNQNTKKQNHNKQTKIVLKNDANMEIFVTKNSTKTDKYKKTTKLNSIFLTEHETDMNITKINKYKKKLNSTSTTEHKTDMNITNSNKYKKLNSTSTTEPKAEHNYSLVNHAINIHKSKKGITNLKNPHKWD